VGFFRSIRFRLTIWYLTVIAVLLGAFGVSAYVLLSNQLLKTLDQSLSSTAVEIESGLRLEGGKITIVGQSNDLVLVYDSNGDLALRLGPNVAFSKVDLMVQNALLGLSDFETETIQGGQRVRLYAAPFTILPDTRVAVIVGRPPSEANSVLSTVRSIFVLSAFIVVGLAALGGMVMANRALSPVLRMTGLAENIGESSLGSRLEINSQDELGRLGSTLNRMIDRLETAFNRQRQFAADASHELRTPLSVIQAEASLALSKERGPDDYRKSLEIVSQEVAYMTNMLGSLLQMARSESGKEPLKFERVNLKEVLEDLEADVESLAREKGLDFDLSLLGNVEVEGDRVKLRQLFLNILDNALRYTPSGGSISASLIAKDGFAVVRVSDTGIGIPEEQLELIFERFHSVDKARSRSEGGAGLGLAIAKQIVENHNGRIEVESKVGKGSTFRIFLPLSEPWAADSESDIDTADTVVGADEPPSERTAAGDS
jgi:heavy metal sensor kinase